VVNAGGLPVGDHKGPLAFGPNRLFKQTVSVYLDRATVDGGLTCKRGPNPQV
jgi:hypothetical protein